MRSSGDEHHDVIRAIYDSGSFNDNGALLVSSASKDIRHEGSWLSLELFMIYYTSLRGFFVVHSSTQASVCLYLSFRVCNVQLILGSPSL